MDFFLSLYSCFPLIKLCFTAYKKVDLKNVMDRIEDVTGEEELTKYI